MNLCFFFSQFHLLAHQNVHFWSFKHFSCLEHRLWLSLQQKDSKNFSKVNHSSGSDGLFPFLKFSLWIAVTEKQFFNFSGTSNKRECQTAILWVLMFVPLQLRLRPRPVSGLKVTAARDPVHKTLGNSRQNLIQAQVLGREAEKGLCLGQTPYQGDETGACRASADAEGAVRE